MRDSIISNCEKNFVQNLVAQGHRLDGRSYNESRKLDIQFGSSYGSCVVSLGDTKVLSQVSCEVVQPKQIRPNEGILYINLEVGPMAAPQFEANRQTDLAVYLNRLLEKCYKDSKCLDLESLCIVVEEKVWSFRVDLKVLNHGGNVVECASIATLSSLAHFKRPDVTKSGDTVTIHTMVEKDPIPTVLYHYPVCLTYAIFGNDVLLTDPSLIEESVCMSSTESGIQTGGGLLVIGMNQYRELCLLDLTGAAIQSVNLVYRATKAAEHRCKEIVDLVKMAIVADDTVRSKRLKVNFADMISSDHILSLSKKDLSICLKSYKAEIDQDEEMDDVQEETEKEDDSKYTVIKSGKNTAETKKKEGSAWIEVSSDSEDDDVIITGTKNMK